ncbi:MAG: hypothetical protein US49_C0003G0040 [candidate division TM6 bacterium GW2011_GWF2_37_49]|nr:MAG: hypothetical protein US49_C0003G0040 [candidate division TM6 bacterium GW2011_GWF2_37_49]
MKIAKLFLLVALTCATSLNAAKNPPVSVTSSSQSVKSAKNKYAEAVQKIMAAQPTTLTGDIVRDLSAAIIATGLQLGTQMHLHNYYNLSENVLATPIFPILRYLIDIFIRKTGAVDQALDALIASKGLDIEALGAADIDIKELEAKINKLSDKNEKTRWVARVVVAFVVLLSMMYKAKEVTVTPEEKGSWISMPSIKNTPYMLGSHSMTIEAIALAIEMYTQSGTYKKASRLDKLATLKQLLSQAKPAPVETESSAFVEAETAPAELVVAQ